MNGFEEEKEGRKTNKNTTNKNTLILSFSLFSKEATEVLEGKPTRNSRGEEGFNLNLYDMG